MGMKKKFNNPVEAEQDQIKLNTLSEGSDESEALSAVFDDEANAIETKQVLTNLTKSKRAQEAWRSYSLISAVMKGELRAMHPEFVRATRARLNSPFAKDDFDYKDLEQFNLTDPQESSEHLSEMHFKDATKIVMAKEHLENTQNEPNRSRKKN